MAKEMERQNIPVAQICTVVNVALETGANRVIPSNSVLYPTGNPLVTEEEELTIRKSLIKQALSALRTKINEATLFEQTGAIE